VARDPEISFACKACGSEAAVGPSGAGSCPACGAALHLPLSDALRERRQVDVCPACQGRQIYVQRDFNQRAGLAIVVAGALLAPFTPYYSSLFAAALLDAVLYAVLPEIAICYRCQAHFRGFRRNPEHKPFDLHLAEQYGKAGD
jgi:uncharacterized paraquat-inducible protein A